MTKMEEIELAKIEIKKDLEEIDKKIRIAKIKMNICGILLLITLGTLAFRILSKF